ncbi:MAG: fumarylacetoacetate hydrolase family protein [Janthinobacterium lividum]
MTSMQTPADLLPADPGALLVGRVWSHARGGPCPVLVRDGQVHDLCGLSPTLAGLLELDGLPGRLARVDAFPSLGELAAFLGEDEAGGPAGRLLAPCDLQTVKAAGVTFADSMLERMIEERAKGDPAAALSIRARLEPVVGANLRDLRAGSPEAARVKQVLQGMDLWSQYLEVGIGPDAEVFTKAPPMATVGTGASVGIHPGSEWNNPEPEVVLAVSSRGEILGATLGNDVNLRDFEGRSALLLGKAKDNNASCAIGPFLRLFDGSFTLESVERLVVSLSVTGRDGFEMGGESRMDAISRAPAELVAQTIGPNHQYPDGFMLFLGTMFAPTKDRRGAGLGFTHELGDVVRISAPELGTLCNRVERSDRAAPWEFGVLALIANLRGRGAL